MLPKLMSYLAVSAGIFLALWAAYAAGVSAEATRGELELSLLESGYKSQTLLAISSAETLKKEMEAERDVDQARILALEERLLNQEPIIETRYKKIMVRGVQDVKDNADNGKCGLTDDGVRLVNEALRAATSSGTTTN